MAINSRKVLYSKGKNDECYTPDYGVRPIIPYIERYRNWIGADYNRPLIVWCPFDRKNSWFVKLISLIPDVKVAYSHIDQNQNFFDYEPEKWDIIVSNPPFSNKRKYFERALSFNKPFALIMSNTWLNDSAPKQLFKDKDLQLLMFEKRMKFIKSDGTIENKITFSSSYYCWDFLPKQIIMEKFELLDK